MNPVIYRCPLTCPFRKKCFIIKTVTEIEKPLAVLIKCAAKNNMDVRVTIGGNKRPP